jgi:hypothetical protein
MTDAEKIELLAEIGGEPKPPEQEVRPPKDLGELRSPSIPI